MKLEIANLSKKFDERYAVENASFFGENLRSLALIGPSGGGKSTLLRLIAGLEIPTEGSIIVNDIPLVFEESFLQTYRKSLGIVFQSFNLFPHLTALENITLPLIEVHRLSKVDALKRANDALKRFRLATHAHHKPAALSGGQRQRIAIARAIAIRPKLLLFDEPTSALDPEMTAEVLDLIYELRDEEGLDFILVTHEMGFAKAVAEQTIFLEEGKIIEYGSTKTLFESPENESIRNFFSRILRYD